MNDRPSQPDCNSDERLNRLLQASALPEPDPQVIARLQHAWDEAVRSQNTAAPSESVATPRLVRSADVPEPRAGSGSWWRVVIAAGVVAAAFAMGRWTGNDHPDSVTRVDSPGEAEAADDGDNKSDVSAPAGAVKSVVENPDAHAGMSDDAPMLAAEDTEDEPSLVPVPDPERPFRRGRMRSAAMREAVDSVLACLEETPEADSSCVQPLMKFRRESEYLLWQVVQNATGQRRLAAVTAIGFVGSERSVPSLVQALSEEDIRGVSLASIKRCADEQTLAVFIQQQQDPELALEFARVLLQRPAERAQPVFLSLMEQPQTRTICLKVVEDLSETFLKHTWNALDSRRVSERVAAVLVLGARRDKATFGRIVSSIRSHPTRWEPVAALMWNGSPDAIRLLNQMQHDPQLFAVMQTAAIQLQSFVGQEQHR